ncbi:MAG: SAM-dependent methyltransferase [Anaerolineae bacterium]|nr:SAM-dependent methyltransferase [Anaerolineae bacterium]
MPEVNPFATVRQLAAGYIVPRCLHVIANLGVADVLDETPRTAAELAESVGAHPDALWRILRVLSTYGLFALQGDQFSHTPASRLLRSDHPQSMRSFVRMFASPLYWNAYGELEYTAQTERPATDKSTPNGFWNYLESHPDEGTIFDEAMVTKSRAAAAAIASSYDFSGFEVVGDIGGGLGQVLRAIMNASPNSKGVLFDLAHVLEKAKYIPSERITFQAGDFFSDTFPTCDAYLLMDVIHDWGDEAAMAILKAVRRAAPAHAKLLVIELVFPDDPGPDWAKVLDVNMLALFGGRQRTLSEYRALLESAGFSLQRKIDTRAEHSILEAVVA